MVPGHLPYLPWTPSDQTSWQTGDTSGRGRWRERERVREDRHTRRHRSEGRGGDRWVRPAAGGQSRRAGEGKGRGMEKGHTCPPPWGWARGPGPLPHVHCCLLSGCSCRRPHGLGAPPLSRVSARCCWGSCQASPSPLPSPLPRTPSAAQPVTVDTRVPNKLPWSQQRSPRGA